MKHSDWFVTGSSVFLILSWQLPDQLSPSQKLTDSESLALFFLFVRIKHWIVGTMLKIIVSGR